MSKWHGSLRKSSSTSSRSFGLRCLLRLPLRFFCSSLPARRLNLPGQRFAPRGNYVCPNYKAHQLKKPARVTRQALRFQPAREVGVESGHCIPHSRAFPPRSPTRAGLPGLTMFLPKTGRARRRPVPVQQSSGWPPPRRGTSEAFHFPTSPSSILAVGQVTRRHPWRHVPLGPPGGLPGLPCGPPYLRTAGPPGTGDPPGLFFLAPAAQAEVYTFKDTSLFPPAVAPGLKDADRGTPGQPGPLPPRFFFSRETGQLSPPQETEYNPR